MRGGSDGFAHPLARLTAWVLVPATSGCAFGNADLLHHWKADGNAQDAVGAADGVITGDVRFEPGQFGLAFRMAEGGFVAFPAPAGRAFQRDFTICLWLRFDVGMPAAVLSKGSGCGRGERYRIESRPDGDLRCSVVDDETGSVDLLTRKADLFDGGWHHVGWRRETDAHSVWVDGCPLVSPTSLEFGDLAIATELTLGGPWCQEDGAVGLPFAGWIDEVRWYAGALGDGEIIELARGPIASDLTGDGRVNAADLALVLGSWGACSGCCPADLDGGGSVDANDLAILLGEWSVD